MEHMRWIAFLGSLTAIFIGGFVMRLIRRKVYFGDDHTTHQALSFEILFQGATILYPQLPYPSVEQAFIRSQTQLSIPYILGWFQVRTTSAFIIPTVLIGVVLLLAHQWIWAALVFGICVLFLVYRSIAFFHESAAYTRTWRFDGAVLCGVLAVLAEGCFFVLAASLMGVSADSWKILFMYAVTLTVFELSPVPLALGVLEVAYFLVAYFLQIPMIFVLLPLAYRLLRSVPILILMLFYLPRYKLSVLDIFHPSLALALLHTRRPADAPSEALDSKEPQLSIVIPAYNEAERLPVFLPAVIEYAQRYSPPAEIVVVDDGSADETSYYVRNLTNQFPFIRLLVQPVNKGKGAAVRRGMLEARGSYILFADADGATPIGEASKLLEEAKKGGDVVIASRQLVDSESSRSLFRGLLGAVFYRLTNLLAVPGIADTQCGFKLMPRAIARDLFAMLKEDGWAFDVELLYLSQKRGLTIVEVPVTWTAIEGSKVHPVRDAVRMFWALMRIRKQWKGMSTGIT